VSGPAVAEIRPWRSGLVLPFPASAVNAALDRLVRPTQRVAGRRASSFRLCGYVGLAVAVAVSQAVVAAHGGSATTMGLLTVTAVGTFLALVVVASLVVGEEVLVYYHHEVAVLATSALVLWSLGRPVLAYLDAVVLGLAGFLACGRIGCLLVGCCHGRPARVGAVYGDEHATHGFTAGYVGVRLLPVPAIEAAAVAGIVVGGLVQVRAGAAPGQALVWHVAAYGAIRSWLELLRGDPGRPHVAGLSQAQWTAVLLVAAVAVAVGAGAVPGTGPVIAVSLALTGAAAGVAARRGRRDRRSGGLLAPRHLAELAALVGASSSAPAVPPGAEAPRVMGPSSAGVVLSTGSGAGAEGGGEHYALSVHARGLTSPEAVHLARVILRVRHPDVAVAHVVAGRAGVHHLVVPAHSFAAAPAGSYEVAEVAATPVS